MPPLRPDRSRLVRRTLQFIDVLLVASLLAALGAWVYDPFRAVIGGVEIGLSWNFTTGLIPILLLGLRVWLDRIGGERTRKRLAPRLALAIATILVLLVGLDGSLALLGFKPLPGVFALRPRDGTRVYVNEAMVYDSRLRWRFQPGGIFQQLRVNNMGFLDREVSTHKIPGTRRIICMGDSCTAGGPHPYSERLHDLLQAAPPPGGPWEAFNTGVPGYSVMQGLALFKQRVCHFEPDIVTIYFGWNDHFYDNAKDSELMADASELMGEASETWLESIGRALSRKRLGILMPGAIDTSLYHKIRVPPEEFERGLQALIHNIRAAGAEPIVLTAPRAESLDAQVSGQRDSRETNQDVSRRHDQYVEIVRRVAKAEEAHVIDLAAELAGPAHAALFVADGIHLSATGLQCIAERVFLELSKRADGIGRKQITTVAGTR